MNILSIQSWVAYGHVGNASAVFPMQRLGHEVWAVNTVQFSNHTGYGAWKGQVFSGEAIRELVDGIAERGVVGTCNGVLSGYMGDAAIGEAVLDAVARVKAANPAALYCCDPVIGDVGRGVFVRPGIPEFMRERTVPAADIVTPNHFELELLSGREARDAVGLAGALDAVHALGPKVIVVTSLHTGDTPEGALDLLVSDAKRALARAHAAAAGVGQRGRGCDRGVVLRSLSRDEQRRRGALPCGVVGLRPAEAHGRGGFAGNPHCRGARRIRGSHHAFRSRAAVRQRRFVTLDVFTDRRFAGNPLAIVLDAEGLDAAAMQAVAREFNLSETVFLLPPRDPVNLARLRIFTPAYEMPFAGHPTIGTAIWLGRQNGAGFRDDLNFTSKRRSASCHARCGG